MDNTPLQPMAYVCVVSEYNLPELEACLTRRPTVAVLVVSRFIAGKGAHRRLQQSLEAQLPGIRVEILGEQDGHPLGGEDVLETSHWMNAVLLARLQQADLAGLPHCLNFTGGTKAMIAALLAGYRWPLLDYRALGSSELQVLTSAPGTEASAAAIRFQEQPRLPLQGVSPHIIAGLYADNVRAGSPNPILAEARSLPLARAIWQAQQESQPELRSLFQALEKLWATGRDNPDWSCGRISLAWQDFLPDGASQPAASLLAWLEHFQPLDHSGTLRWDARQIHLPGNQPRGRTGKHLRAWLCGDWLEQLAFAWLEEAGIPEAAIARNLLSGQNSDSRTQREADLLIHYRHRTNLIEVKAGLPPGHAPNELETQVSSLGSRFGRTRKALLVSPQLQRQLQETRRWDSFARRCQANEVALLASREELLDFVGIHPEQPSTGLPAA